MELSALYLPQFHEIPENNAFWGDGFTEWTNVRRARPLFFGHQQPKAPGELGYYNLLDPQIRERQADLARAHGITSFCYWHYWFAGRQVLERPLNEVIASGNPRFPFFLGWANDSWTGVWYGSPGRVLIEQTYPGINDHRAHFESLLPAFRDSRYVHRDGRPVFLIFRPEKLPEPARFIELWQNLARRAGFRGLYLIAHLFRKPLYQSHVADGFDAAVYVDFPFRRSAATWLRTATRLQEIAQQLVPFLGPRRYPFATEFTPSPAPLSGIIHPCAVPNWDNTPRSGLRGTVALNATPEQFKEQLARLLRREIERESEADRQLVFIKSWNEWAEGNYLEPDEQHGSSWLDAVRDARQIAGCPRQ